MTALPGTPPPCPVCDAPRSRHDAVKGAACSSLRCQTELLQSERRRENEAFDLKCQEFALSFAAGLEGSDHVVARVPYLDRPIVKTPNERKLEFRRSFRNSLRATFGDVEAGSLATVHPYTDGASNPVIDASCIACRGFCCRQGAGHAFLNQNNLPSILGRRPAENPARIYRDYVSHIPDEAVEDSCVYHGAMGCTLPRTMRSDTCNDYECKGRQSLGRSLVEKTQASAVVVAMDGYAIKSAAIATPDAALEWLTAPDQD